MSLTLVWLGKERLIGSSEAGLRTGGLTFISEAAFFISLELRRAALHGQHGQVLADPLELHLGVLVRGVELDRELELGDGALQLARPP